MTARNRILLGTVVLSAAMCLGQAAQQPTVPDAPSASKPVQPLPAPPAATPANTPPAPARSQDIKEVPPGQATAEPGSPRDQLFTLTKNVNFVLVPVTVKDKSSGRLVEGLTLKDFTVLEDEQPQRVTFFTSDPFPLSVAVVLDLGVPEVAFQKVKNTLSALVGAFGQFDEVTVYTYSHTVQKVQDFTGINERLSAAMKKIKQQKAEEGGVPVVGGPFNSPISTSGRPIDPGTPPVQTPTKESRVLNDAILEAALDLSHRAPDRRKILFVISDGREYNSDASYSETLKVLLSHEVALYAIGIGSAALPIYGRAQRIRLPGAGYGDILPKYAAATGGEVFNEFTQAALEQAYSRITADARNQYTIGYTTRATASSSYRNIEVRVRRPGLKVDAKQGYYPAPARREN